MMPPHWFAARYSSFMQVAPLWGLAAQLASSPIEAWFPIQPEGTYGDEDVSSAYTTNFGAGVAGAGASSVTLTPARPETHKKPHAMINDCVLVIANVIEIERHRFAV